MDIILEPKAFTQVKKRTMLDDAKLSVIWLNLHSQQKWKFLQNNHCYISFWFGLCM